MDNMEGTYYSYSQLIELLHQVSEEKRKEMILEGIFEIM